MQEYQEALGLIRDGKVEKGRAALNDFIADNPKSPLLPNALYWLGESFYHEKRYGQAILTFKEVLRRFPKHHKSPASLLKIGYSYANLGDAQNARFYLETLIQEYPESEPAPMARNKLGQLGG
jgi:tol-pal system protein YbgF